MAQAPPPNGNMTQLTLPGFNRVEAALERLAETGVEERGAVFTRREVVEFILDLVGYVPTARLFEWRLMEPSFGAGDFLVIAVERLLAAYRAHGPAASDPVVDLRDCLRAVELHRPSFDDARRRLLQVLAANGLSSAQGAALADAWLRQGDFLLSAFDGEFTHVVGNPPYVRQESIPEALIAEYRTRFQTIFDRADLYVPFIEKSLSHLASGGVLGFICSDRWMKNRYGGPLRRVVSERFHLKFYVDMVDTPAFHADVIAYPAVIVIADEPTGPTRIAHRPAIEAAALARLAQDLLRKDVTEGGPVKEISNVAAGAEPWLLESFDQLAVVRRLERTFPTLEEAGCRVGIGVATGADSVFIGPFETLDVEPECKLPLAMTKDILRGKVLWRGYGIVNPFRDDGGLVNLKDHPRLARYLERHKAVICKRHVAKRNPHAWYRTIDRIYPELAREPKLLIPDIKGEPQIVYEAGRLYPHHNLYFITSTEWDLKALQAVLNSGIARLFVSIYSIRMRGGYLRFQAQYLRRILLPRWSEVAPALRTELVAAAERGDTAACNAAAFDLYGLSSGERTAIGGDGG